MKNILQVLEDLLMFELPEERVSYWGLSQFTKGIKVQKKSAPVLYNIQLSLEIFPIVILWGNQGKSA